jgi:protein involved in ribonucleotide reduction
LNRKSMRKIQEKLKQQLLSDDYYKKCARKDIHCKGRITWEHAFIYAGKQINEKWAIIPLCEWHHGIGQHQNINGLDKRINQHIALERATEADLDKYPNVDWWQKISYLRKYNESKNMHKASNII